MDDELEYEAMPDTEPAPPEEAAEEPGLESEEDMEAEAALNTALPMSERVSALKNAIELCVQRQMGGEYGGKEKEGGEDMLTSLLGGG